MVALCCVLTLAAGAQAQVGGVLDFEVRASLSGAFADVAIGPEGRVFLLDGRGETVTVFSGDLQRSLAVFDLRQHVDGKVVAIAVAPDGALWSVTDRGFLARFGALGMPAEVVRFPGKGTVTLTAACALTTTHDGAAVILDRAKKTLVVVEPSGTVRTQMWGVHRLGVTFSDPIDVAVDREGYYLVADAAGGGVCRIDPWGMLRHRWSAGLPSPMKRPCCVATDQGGLAYVADEAGRCLVLADTALVAMFGTAGRLPGQLNRPIAMAATPGGDIVIVDQDPPRVQVFAVAGLAPWRERLASTGRFLPVRSRPGESWPLQGIRLDAHEGRIAWIVANRKDVFVASWREDPTSPRALVSLEGVARSVADVAVLSDGRLALVDPRGPGVWVVGPDDDAPTPLSCPLGSWKSPHRVTRGPSGSPIVWDSGHQAVVWAGGEEAVVPLEAKDVEDLGSTPDGEAVALVSGRLLHVTRDGTISPIEARLPALTAVTPWGEGVVAGLADGGIAGIGLAGEVHFIGGVALASAPSVTRVTDLAADGLVVLALTPEGRVTVFEVENAGRAGVAGVVTAARGGPFTVRLEPISAGPSVEARIGLGRFLVEGIVPGVYRWSLRAPGWMTVSGPTELHLLPGRVEDVGSVVMEPAGEVIGAIEPPGIVATVRALQGLSAVATSRSSPDGRFRLTDLPPGEYELSVEASGYRLRDAPPRFSIRASEVTELPVLSLVKLGSLKGYVKPLAADQEVWLLRDGMVARVCRTEALPDAGEERIETLGRFECRDLEPGRYWIVVRTRGFYPDTSLGTVLVEEGMGARCGTAILSPAPSIEGAEHALRAFDRAVEDYGLARFIQAYETIHRLLMARELPCSALDRAYMMLGWCAIARGPTFAEVARRAFRMAFVVNPWIEPGPDASPTVVSTMESIRRELFGEHAVPEVFRP